jgi:hypothetical protein
MEIVREDIYVKVIDKLIVLEERIVLVGYGGMH